MENEKLEIMINEFLDGELPKEKENYLFSSLGNDKEAREYFKKLNSIKLAVSETNENFPQDLEEKIFTQLKSHRSSPLISLLQRNRFSFLTYALVVLLFVTGYFFFDQYNYQQEQLELARKQMNQQEQLIELIMNNQLPPVNVEPDSENEIVIQATL